VFSATEGLSLEHFIIRQRVEAAQCLLREGTLPVGRVARELGYSNLGHFAHRIPTAMLGNCGKSAQR
jgi:AraC-like DNA-binding protein